MELGSQPENKVVMIWSGKAYGKAWHKSVTQQVVIKKKEKKENKCWQGCRKIEILIHCS